MNPKPENTKEGGNEPADKAMPGGVIRVDESMIKSHLDKVVVSTVEQTLNAMLDAESGMGVLRILTDRGTEYCGRPEQHPYELYLAINNIDHTKTKAKSPQTNGIAERFHKTILQEFYQITFHKKLYQDIESLQADLDEWMRYYNHERTHQGKMCCGRTPWQTWLDAIPLWKQKVDALNQQPIIINN